MEHDSDTHHTQSYKKPLVIIAIFVFILVGVVVVGKKGLTNKMGGNKPTPVAQKGSGSGGKMYLTSVQDTHVFPVNEDFTLQLRVDTQSKEVGGYDAVIMFDNSKLDFIEAKNLVDDFEMFTNQIVAQDPIYTMITVTGIMKLEKQKPFAFQEEPVALLTFRTKSVGTSMIEFNFTQGETNDSNLVLINTEEILSEVENFSVSVGQTHMLNVGQTYVEPTSKLSAKLTKIIAPDEKCNDCTTDAEVELTYKGSKALLTFSTGGFAGKVSDRKAALSHTIEVKNITAKSLEISVIPE